MSGQQDKSWLNLSLFFNIRVKKGAGQLSFYIQVQGCIFKIEKGEKHVFFYYYY